jgi:hypothetical protein
MEKKEEKIADNLLKDINTDILELKQAKLKKEASVHHNIFIKLSKSLRKRA